MVVHGAQNVLVRDPLVSWASGPPRSLPKSGAPLAESPGSAHSPCCPLLAAPAWQGWTLLTQRFWNGGTDNVYIYKYWYFFPLTFICTTAIIASCFSLLRCFYVSMNTLINPLLPISKHFCLLLGCVYFLYLMSFFCWWFLIFLFLLRFRK